MIDVEHQINATARAVGVRTMPAGELHVVTITRTYDTTVEDLWDACTNPERIPRWFLPVSGELRPGGRYQLQGNAGGTIESCDPPTGFTATWEFGPQVSWIELRLSPAAEPGRTRFQLDHLVPDDDHWAQFGPGAVGIGWDLGLMGLGLHLDGGSVDREAIAAWMASAEYRRMVTGAGDAWRAAQLAAGVDPATAEAQATRTKEAYGAGL